MEALDLSKTKSTFADLTFGAGGHTQGILNKFKQACVYSFDQDEEAINNGKAIVDKYQERLKLIHANFEDFPKWSEEENLLFDGIIADLGVSSHQFDQTERGFSYKKEANLDMRMNKNSSAPTGAELVNELPEEELANLIFEYGEERFSRRIAKNIVEKRGQEPIKTTSELEEIVFRSYPSQKRHSGIHPATRTFQALRIAVNRELDILKNTLPKLSKRLKPGGVIAIISFHSLEDRIVKHTFKDLVDNLENRVKIITKKPLIPSEVEVRENPRARSAKLRILQFLGEDFGLKKEKKAKYSRQ